MTNERAIEILNSLKDYYNDRNVDSYVGFDDEDNEALDMAIKALEQQPCEDCISREAVIRLVEQYPNIIGSRCSGLIADIKHLPSVTPSIPDVENDFNLGYNCGYADAMCDIGGES